MKLYLVQHADALSKAVDPDRPLSPKGQQDVADMAVWLKKSGVHVDEVVHSGKLRAEQTANAYGMAVLPDVSAIKLEGLSPNDSTDHLMHGCEIAGGDLMVVGHLPFMARMAARCLTGAEDGITLNYQPGSIVCLQRIDDEWVMNWMMRPEMLG